MTTRPLVVVIIVVALVTAACTSGSSRSGSEALPNSTRTPIPCAPSGDPSKIDQPLPRTGSFDANGVRLHLTRTFPSVSVVRFGVPVPEGAVVDPRSVKLAVAGQTLPAVVTATLRHHDKDGNPTGVRAIVVELPATALDQVGLDVDIAWRGGQTSGGAAGASAAAQTTFAQSSAPSNEVVDTAERTIETVNGRASLRETSRCPRVLFEAREPAVLATFPDGYVASTGILGPLVSASRAHQPDLAGLSFVADQAAQFGLSAMYRESYPLNPDPESVVDPVAEYEGWLYDRCATFLSLYAVDGDSRFLREAFRSCWYYQSKIGLSGEMGGIFTGKPERDTKYSHLRGLLAYYALTGDEGARAAGQAVAELWLNDEEFAGPYRRGHIGNFWTERLLATSMEGMIDGFELLDDKRYLDAFKELLTTAYRHITGDAAALSALSPVAGKFPPQNCFIHSAGQHGEGADDQPWCSGWMSELTIAPLLAYQDVTEDPRVDEILVRLTRFLRDVGTSYFTSDPIDDTFLKPTKRYRAEDGENVRRLIPLYGAGLGKNGKRQNSGEYDDYLHCMDATALTAAGLRSLERQGAYDRNPVGPFPSEGASFLALHHELAQCAKLTFADQTRLNRDPARQTSDELAAGRKDPAAFIKENKIGFPSRTNAPLRRLSWWFNSSLLQFGLLSDAHVPISRLEPGRIQP